MWSVKYNTTQKGTAIAQCSTVKSVRAIIKEAKEFLGSFGFGEFSAKQLDKTGVFNLMFV